MVEAEKSFDREKLAHVSVIYLWISTAFSLLGLLAEQTSNDHPLESKS